MSDNWIVEQNGWDRKDIEFLGSKFTMANGYFGYRGTMEEYGKEQLAACTLSEIYDDSGSGWREIVNIPNPLHVKMYQGEQALSLLEMPAKSHRQELDLKRALHCRETEFALPQGSVSIRASRFASADDVHLLCARYRVVADHDVHLTANIGIDPDLWELNGPHYGNICVRSGDRQLQWEGTTVENGYQIGCVQRITATENVEEAVSQESSERQFVLSLKKNVPAQFDIYVSICKSTDCKEPLKDACELACKAQETGWDALLEAHCKVWSKRWEDFDVEIEGDDRGQLALRHSIFLLIGTAPFHTEGIAIPARGLSGQVYKGAMFWDTEMYFLPMFLYCAPEVARNLVTYRTKNLQGAMEKAAEEGYSGAFFPWESQETGKEGCTYFNLTDIFTNRPVRTYFRDKQVHISAAVAYGILSYIRATGDLSLLEEGGARTLLECAEFFWSYAYYKAPKKRFELLDVTGPDEYHERVNNNVYTNAMARETAVGALEVLELLEKTKPEAYAKLRQEDPKLEEKREHARRLAQEIYVPQPRSEDGVIEQYDGFFKKEDCTIEDIRSRIIEPNEYLGSPTGLTVETQVAKQADVVLLMCTLDQQYSQQEKRANWQYYEPRCEHGSSLSTCVYALLAAQIGDTDWAYRYFLKAAELDLRGGYKLYLGPLYIGGTHPAANGGSWRVAVQGFGGLSVQEDCVTLNPHLPDNWKKLSYRFCAKGQWFRVQLTASEIRVTADRENGAAVLFRVGKRQIRLSCGESMKWEYGNE